ncbi:5250_t:CDS:2 [Ambispora gerdemannii]|uniref:5250_t:CDS:1 n=1 Tax=Ambispora gerdemannii TaxID=144530 RepID=A0A9N9DQZ9_9GLOM|nr:5250_t:CDS:2 [Ambispora gerdemannii]
MISLGGLLAALLGNSVIGLGNCLQKYALQRGGASETSGSSSSLQETTSTTNTFEDDSQEQLNLLNGKSITFVSSPLLDRHSLTINRFTGKNDEIEEGDNEIAGVNLSPNASTTTLTPMNINNNSIDNSINSDNNINKRNYSRFRDRTWFLGISLVYLGELFGNWVALALIPASVVIPLGILGVIVNAILANFLLGENVSFHQKIGYIWILTGVLAIILFSAANEMEDKLWTGAEIVNYMLQFRVLGWLLVIFITECILILTVRRQTRKKESSLVFYVLMTAGFGALTVVSSKFLALLLTCWLFLSNQPSDGVREKVNLGQEIDTLIYRAQRNNIQLMFGDEMPTSIIIFALFALLVNLVIGIGGQEICKQIALSKYRITQFQPMFYASHVTFVAISGMIVFKEVGGWWSMFGFVIGIMAIIRGASYLLGVEKKIVWWWWHQRHAIKSGVGVASTGSDRQRYYDGIISDADDTDYYQDDLETDTLLKSNGQQRLPEIGEGGIEVEAGDRDNRLRNTNQQYGACY